MVSIIGYYKIQQGEHIIYQSKNLITLLGESFFINRCIDDTIKPIKYILLGNGEIIPLKSDVKLGNEKIRKSCSTRADLDNKRVVLEASFTSSEIDGITEIGVSNGDILISHDTFKEIKSDLLVNPIGTVDIIYSFQFVTGSIRKNWVKYLSNKNIYRLYEPSDIINVFEKDSGIGYKKVGSIDELMDNIYSYYYDNIKKNLYIQCYTSDDESKVVDNTNPITTDIIVETR